jgi:hypothetical protein
MDLGCDTPHQRPTRPPPTVHAAARTASAVRSTSSWRSPRKARDARELRFSSSCVFMLKRIYQHYVDNKRLFPGIGRESRLFQEPLDWGESARGASALLMLGDRWEITHQVTLKMLTKWGDACFNRVKIIPCVRSVRPRMVKRRIAGG